MKKIFALLTAGFLAFGFVGCSLPDGQNGTDSENDEPKADVDPYPTAELYYPLTTNSFFAKLTVKKLLEDIYSDDAPSMADAVVQTQYVVAQYTTETNGEMPPDYAPHIESRYLVLQCTVEEDYYGCLQTGETVHLPVLLYDEITAAPTPDDGAALRQYLSEFNTFFVYSSVGGNNVKLYSMVSGATLDCCQWCALGGYDLIPVQDNKPQLTSLCSFMTGENISYLSPDQILGMNELLGEGANGKTDAEKIKKFYHNQNGTKF